MTTLQIYEDRVTQHSTKTPAPIAPRRPHTFTTHGISVTDDYAWLKDEKWQDVLRDPSILDADIMEKSCKLKDERISPFYFLDLKAKGFYPVYM